MSDTPATGRDEVEAASAGVVSSHFSTRILDGTHVVTVSRPDVVDAQYIEQLGDSIYRHFKAIATPRVVLDMSKVKFFSSAALGMLIALKKVLEKQGGGLRVACVAEDLQNVFKITKLHKLIGMHDTIDDAIRSLG